MLQHILCSLNRDVSFSITVNPNSLTCQDQQQSDDNDDDDDDNAVCGTNGVTYPSLCRLIQDTGNEAVAYAGECDRDECKGGPVSDMPTLLRALSMIIIDACQFPIGLSPIGLRYRWSYL